MVGGLIYYWWNQPIETQVSAEPKMQTKLPDEISQEAMETDLDEIAEKMNHVQKREFYRLQSKVIEDMRRDTIFRFDDRKFHKEFRYGIYESRIRYMMQGIGYVAFAINRLNKGDYNPNYESCVRESAKIAVAAALDLGRAHHVLASRNIQHTVRDMLNLMIRLHYNTNEDFELVTIEKEVAV